MTPDVVAALSLLLSVSLCSSAAIVFDILTNVLNVDPFLAGFWRLFLQTFVQIPFFLQSYSETKKLDKETEINEYHSHLGLKLDASEDTKDSVQQRELIIPKYYRSLPLCALSGIFLGIHFSMWIYSLRYTSISHSLLWVSMGPIVLNGGNWILFVLSKLFKRLNSVHRPSYLETFGTITGMAGACIILVDVTKTDSDSYNSAIHRPSVYGDLSAFSGAVAVSAYLVIGSKLRAFLPLWLYIFPVIGFASLTCLAFALFNHNSDVVLYGAPNSSVLGFISKQYLPFVIYLAIGPGIGGHTMLNGLLKYISPLTISTAMLGEPIIGSLMGYIVGVQPFPGKSTIFGGSILLIGLFLVVRGSNIKTNKTNYGLTKLNDEQSERLRTRFVQYGAV